MPATPRARPRNAAPVVPGVSPSHRSQFTRHAARTGAGAVGTVVVLGFSLSLTLEYFHASAVSSSPLQHVVGLGVLLGLGGLVTSSLLGLVAALVGRLWPVTALAVMMVSLIGLTNHLKIQFRMEPLFPSDVLYLGDIGFLLANVAVGDALGLVVLVVLGPSLVSLFALFVLPRWRGKTVAVGRPNMVLFRIVSGLAAAAILFAAAGFNRDGNPLRHVYDGAVEFWAHWSQTENYFYNGFIAGFLYNLPAPAMEEPSGYSAATIGELADKYRELALETNTLRRPDALADTNVIVVLGETFTDPFQVAGAVLEEDPIPFTRQLMSVTSSGTMVSSGFGGGTANVEFEVLTGMAVANFSAQTHTPFQMLVAGSDRFPSFLQSLGTDRSAIAIHPFSPDYYQRERAYAALDFDHARFLSDMEHTATVEDNDFVSDASTYREALSVLRETDEPLLLNVVTMQNHSPYMAKYANPIAVSGEFPNANSAYEVSFYLAGLRHSDHFLRQFVDDLQQLDEPTIMLFYGDHLPSSWPEEVLAEGPDLSRHLTPWFVWANFETALVQPDVPLGPNHLINQLLTAANAPVTPWGALLTAVQNEIPAMEVSAILDASGHPTDLDSLSPRAEEILEDYRMVQYDMAVGEGFGTQTFLNVPEE